MNFYSRRYFCRQLNARFTYRFQDTGSWSNRGTSCESDHVDQKHCSIKMTPDKQTKSSSWLLRSCKRSRFKIELFYLVFGYLLTHCSARNNPPRFLIDGQTEIVLRLKEGPETPIGKDYFITSPLKDISIISSFFNSKILLTIRYDMAPGKHTNDNHTWEVMGIIPIRESTVIKNGVFINLSNF